ncbi:FG-GAP-like repeat-containing protein [Pseudoflavonifractor phocaeensis]|uniref:FG-GAP-like repeat-containing protein n=1 Tax=Pseudoflavonifractor phocaeensis TaxID=1870988 RepID=UPI001959061E|nr:FG-GAP-like repeat-containing protein [Pseudoflavonifractor phocaeensis]
MLRRVGAAALALCMATGLVSGVSPAAKAQPGQSSLAIEEEYLFAGRNNDYYTEEAYYATPVVVDLDGDGALEAINAAYSLSVVNAVTGMEKWRINAGKDRSTPYSDYGNVASGQVFADFKVLDLDGDGELEIVIGYGNGSLSVLNSEGYFEPGWPQKPTSSPIRSLAVGDVNGDGKLEIVVGVGIASSVSVWVYRSDGTILPGWPQLADSQNANYSQSTITGNAYNYGVFANSIALGDLNGDNVPEIIVPNDTAFIGAYYGDSSLVTASDLFEGRSWGKVAVYEDYDQEISCENEGWGYPVDGDETRAELYRATFGHSAATYSDVDGDGVSEVVVTGLVFDRTGYNQSNDATLEDTRYMTAFIFNQDRTRYVNEALGFDWTSAPRDLGRCLKSYDKVSLAGGVFSEPVCADLDGDGYQEILFNSYNGKLHCFNLDGTEHGQWPFTLPKSTSTAFEFACPPVCKDINGDGKLEVIVASYTENNDRTDTKVNGALYVLDCDGNLLASHDLHDGYASYSGTVSMHNGCMATPLVEDVDGDGKYEVLLNTTYYALCCYELDYDAGKTFSDVAAGSYYEAPVKWAVNKGITTGVSSTLFGINAVCDRAQIMTFLWRTAGSPTPKTTTNPFSDVPAGSYYYDAVLWAVENGITTGTGAGLFSPTRQCSRAEILTFLYRFMGEPSYRSTWEPFRDVDGTEYFYDAMMWSVENHLTDGFLGEYSFGPNTPCVRTEAMTFLYRMVGLVV